MNKKDLLKFYSSQFTISTIKPGRIKWALFLGNVGEIRNAYRNLFGKPEGRGQFEVEGVDGKTRGLFRK